MSRRDKKLKPCPFCSGKAEYRQFANPRNFYCVTCTVCRISTDGFVCRSDGTDAENKAMNAAVWNQRVGETRDD